MVKSGAGEDPEAEMLRGALEEALNQAIDELPVEFREVVILRDVQGLSYAEIAEVGFPLIGGRLDYLGERQVAALVYRRRQHVINLFVWPSRDSNALPTAAARRGNHMVQGAAGGMMYWAISDLNETELSQFAQLVAANLGPGTTRP